MRALVLSGGGLFGAWQAGAWSVLAESFSPDLIVGCSIGALNGYSIASGASPVQLSELWRDSSLGDFSRLPAHLRLLAAQPLRRPLAVTVTDILRMRPVVVRDDQITWQHLAASCAVPLVLPQVRIGGRWYSDGGLLNPLPVWAAVELGATEVLALHVLGRFPAPWLAPVVKSFRYLCGYHPPLPPHVRLTVWEPSQRLGSLRDTLVWKRENIDRWLKLGSDDAEVLSRQKPFPF
ncbi:MAG: patatin-like phospholipase family protein [Acidobacteriota bacterium]